MITYTTPIAITESAYKIQPTDELLFVGSCFADNIGKRFVDNAFRATVNPFGVMYNPISVLHTLQRIKKSPTHIICTLGTNHVYREIATGEIVDNCQKRPQKLFHEEILSVDECATALEQCIALFPGAHFIFTVSPIRYKKYGFHESQLSKATLLLAVDKVLHAASNAEKRLSYFPAYEIMNDELRDYRFYAPDMIHPSEQAVNYIFERFREAFLSPLSHDFYRDYQPIKQALNHRPFIPDSDEYKAFLADALRRKEELLARLYK